LIAHGVLQPQCVDVGGGERKSGWSIGIRINAEDIVEEWLGFEDAGSSADDGFGCLVRGPHQAHAGGETGEVGMVLAVGRTDMDWPQQSRYWTVGVVEPSLFFSRHGEVLIAKSEIEHEIPADAEVILNESAEFPVARVVVRDRQRDPDLAGTISDEIGG